MKKIGFLLTIMFIISATFSFGKEEASNQSKISVLKEQIMMKMKEEGFSRSPQDFGETIVVNRSFKIFEKPAKTNGALLVTIMMVGHYQSEEYFLAVADEAMFEVKNRYSKKYRVEKIHIFRSPRASIEASFLHEYEKPVINWAVLLGDCKSFLLYPKKEEESEREDVPAKK